MLEALQEPQARCPAPSLLLADIFSGLGYVVILPDTIPGTTPA